MTEENSIKNRYANAGATILQKVFYIVHDLTTSAVGIIFIASVIMFMYAETYHPERMDSTIDIEFRVLLIMVLFMALPRALVGVAQIWQFLRNMGEIAA